MGAIEEKVDEILSEIGLDSSPVNVIEIADKNNILVKYAPSNKFSGMIYRKDDTAFIAVNSKESEVRQRFTIAHELGHFFLHPQKDTFIDYRTNSENAVRDTREREANQFAAALLMPRKLIEKDVKGFADTGIIESSIDFLAEKYNVSSEAMTFRLMNLNFLS